MNPVQFAQEVLETEGTTLKYEWATQQMGDHSRLVFHFFAGKHKEVPEIIAGLKDAASGVSDVTVDIGYTGEEDGILIDGHHFILSPVEAWQTSTLHEIITRSLRKALTTQE